jgi:hypothetical protein
MPGRTLARLIATVAVGVLLLGRTARADERIDQLTTMLASSSEKTRLSAVVALARLGDRRTLKPLVTAMHDPDAQIRAIAATALGHLGHKAALPTLRAAANDDTDEAVRTKARDATIAVAKANHLPDDLPKADPDREAREARHSGFGHSPQAVTDQPDLYVLVKTSSDDSPGKADKPTRKINADIVRTTLVDSFRAAPQVTMIASEAQRWGLDPRHLDVSVVKLDVNQSGAYVEIDTELRLAISDDTGKMLSFLSGGAKVSIPRGKFNPRFLPDLRKEALEGAMRGMFDKLLAHLRQTMQS